LALALGLAGCTSPETRARLLYEQAGEAREAGRLGESAGLLEQLIAELPTTEAAGEALPFLAEIRAEREAAALGEVDRLRRAQEDFFGRQRRYAQSIEELLFGRMLGAAPDGPVLGYRFRTRTNPAADGYTIGAESTADLQTRSFFQDIDGVLRQARGEPASAGSPPVQ
jgi:hypothetical protein